VLDFPIPTDNGGGHIETFAPPYFIADDENIYWEDEGMAEVLNGSLADGTTTVLADLVALGVSADQLVLEGANVYAATLPDVSTPPGLYQVSMQAFATSGQAPAVTLATWPAPQYGDKLDSMALAGTSLFWLDVRQDAVALTVHYDVLKTDITTATTSVFLPDFVVCPSSASFLVDPSRAMHSGSTLWEDIATEGTRLSRIPLTGATAPTPIVSQVQLIPVQNGNDVYFVSVDMVTYPNPMAFPYRPDSWFLGVPTALWQSSPSEPLISWSASTVRDVAIDSTAIYWTDIGAPSGTPDFDHQYDPGHRGTIQKRFR
jgi:hypothetical protein